MALKRWIRQSVSTRTLLYDEECRPDCTDRPADQRRENRELPIPPIKRGWLVVYRDQNGRLRGGCDERKHGTVKSGVQDEIVWSFTLTDGTVIPGRLIVSVAETDYEGRVIAAWLVRDHGLDGNRQIFPC